MSLSYLLTLLRCVDIAARQRLLTVVDVDFLGRLENALLQQQNEELIC